MTHPAAEVGSSRAAAHADRESLDWTLRAYRFLVIYARRRVGNPFLMEDVRKAAERSPSYVSPPDGRAWGAVALRAKRDGAIVMSGYAPSESSNGSPKCLWHLAP